MLAEMRRLVRPGGIVVLQEPDSASWSLYPASEPFDHLKSAILTAFRVGGGDFDAGRTIVSMASNTAA